MSAFLYICPFCDSHSAPQLESKSEDMGVDYSKIDEQWRIVCNVHDEGCGSSSGFHKTQEQAIQAWNTRT